MSDHENYCNNSKNDVSITACDIEGFSDESESIVCTEKSGDEFLIKLYKERSLLYDKTHPNFKDSVMKQNAWNEISKTMIEKNCGDFYTPHYCQRRCTSLREQYNREKKRIENQSKSGSAAPSSRQFPLYDQLKFLDQVIKRRRSYSKIVIKCRPDNIIVDESSSGTKIVSDDVNTFSSCNKNTQSTKHKGTIDVERTYDKDDVIISSKRLRRIKPKPTKELEQTSFNMKNRIMSYTQTSTADNAFMEFIKVQFNSIPEHEKNIRRKMMIDAVSTPLPKISDSEHCKCNVLWKQLVKNISLH